MLSSRAQRTIRDDAFLNRSDLNKLSYAVEYGYKASQKDIPLDHALGTFWESFDMRFEEEDVSIKEKKILAGAIYFMAFLSFAFMAVIPFLELSMSNKINLFGASMISLLIAIVLVAYKAKYH